MGPGGQHGLGGVGIWEAAPPSEAVARSAQDMGWHLCLHPRVHKQHPGTPKLLPRKETSC